MNLHELQRKLVKENKYPSYVKVPVLLFSSWLFQGILYMDTTERNFKILLDILIFLPLFILFNQYFNAISSILIAIMMAHTINWIFNGHIFGLLRVFGVTKTKHEVFIQYLDDLKKRSSNEDVINLVAVIGSLSREERKESSDLDIRIIRKKGFKNGLRASLFVMSERTKAFFNKFPIDIYLLDDYDKLSELGEPPVIIYSQ